MSATESTASATPAIVYHGVATIEMPQATLSASAPDADVYESSLLMWPRGLKGMMMAGVWEACPGHLNGRRVGWAEICYIIEGSATITTEGGAVEKIGPGDVLVLPEGWRGSWDIHAKVRKFFAFQRFENFQA
ncbi:MAG: cupin domain-containing protein [Propionibacteriaceae bacterium]|jgi:uncharacterized cupin superfamily protein|nr:cupin domain-containing protein [Propionibacteriaceae bacterium]